MIQNNKISKVIQKKKKKKKNIILRKLDPFQLKLLEGILPIYRLHLMTKLKFFKIESTFCQKILL